MNRIVGRFVLISAVLLHTAAVWAGTAEDTADVQHVMQAFHTAVAGHDGPRLAALFIPEGSTWLNVLSDEGYVRAKAKSPNAAKMRSGATKISLSLF